MRIEFLMPKEMSTTGDLMLRSLANAAVRTGDMAFPTTSYRGSCDVLVLFGVGSPDRNDARNRQVASGRSVLMFDLGYFRREKIVGYLRCSIDHDHPQRLLDRTPADPSRWNALGLSLREDFDPSGPVLLIGLGPKARSYLRERDWEERQLADLQRRFPARRLLYRPKPGNPVPPLPMEMANPKAEIEALLKGASLVVCRHSNVACDAALAGVPFECEDGAAMWLAGKPFTRQNREDFLRRLAWWQWKSVEAAKAWAFLKPRLKKGPA